MRVGKFREVDRGFKDLRELERDELSVGISLGKLYTIPPLKSAKTQRRARVWM